MGIVLAQNTYGKNAVNLSKIIRHKDYHEFRQISVNVSLQGDFETAYTLGDNSKILATDTQKNTVYALAKEHFTSTAEAFGLYLADYFKTNNPQTSQVTIEITEYGWRRMAFDGTTHPHAYSSSGNEKHTCRIVQDNHSVHIGSGIQQMLILKTTDSGFEHFIREKYTTLKETADRIFATECGVNWEWNDATADFGPLYAEIRALLLKTFAFHNSLSVQQTLYAMGESVLQLHEEVKEISLVMPNKHHILFNLEPFGMTNKNEIFIATDEPFGYITGTLKRE